MKSNGFIVPNMPSQYVEQVKQILSHKPTKEEIAERRLKGDEWTKEYWKNLPPWEDESEAVNNMGYCDPNCSTCGGVGFIRTGGGKIDMCPLVSKRVITDPKRVGLSEYEMEFLSWDKIININGIQNAVDAVGSMFLSGRGWLTIYGSNGLGKSLLLTTAIAEAVRKGYQARYSNMADILDDLRKGYSSGMPEIARLNNWSKIPVLAVDEYEKINDTPYAVERTFKLIDNRYRDTVREQALITIIATNAHPRTLDGYVASRMYDNRFRVLELAGTDLRLVADWTKKKDKIPTQDSLI